MTIKTENTMNKTKPVDGKYNLVNLPYGPTALEPVISAETLKFHHGKHLQTYLNNVNAALHGSGLENMPLEEMVTKATGALRNNAGQLLNHNMYFMQFAPPQADNVPSDQLLALIETHFGSFEKFKQEFVKSGAALFGSGWVWLAADADGKLLITQEPNAGNPLQHGLRPLLTMDVWEHAYYLDYQNRRPDYLSALWQIIDWDIVEARYNS